MDYNELDENLENGNNGEEMDNQADNGGEAGEDGTYTAKYFRFDVFNGAVSDNTSYDIAFIALCDDLDTALKLNTGMDEVTLSLNNTEQKIYNPRTGEEITAE